MKSDQKDDQEKSGGKDPLVNEGVHDLLLENDVLVLLNALALFFNSSNGFSKKTVGGGEHVALVHDGHLGRTLCAQINACELVLLLHNPSPQHASHLPYPLVFWLLGADGSGSQRHLESHLANS